MASALLIWKVRHRWLLSTRVEELYHQVVKGYIWLIIKKVLGSLEITKIKDET